MVKSVMKPPKEHKEYETIELTFDKEQLYQLMLRAHEYDMTLNDFIEMALLKFIEEHEQNIL